MSPADIVQKLWNYCNVLREDGMNCLIITVMFWKIWEIVNDLSRFVKKDGRWYSCDGQMLPPVVWGRNQPCWCKSHKKYQVLQQGGL
ncbi:MAG: SEC-C domain-containing protein [Proteobacteria bacterium]|nr:SEC-C domain-containing protein [Pseudomonadota bacterium]